MTTHRNLRFQAMSTRADKRGPFRRGSGIFCAVAVGLTVSGCEGGDEVLAAKDSGPGGVSIASADILFWDDFESGTLDKWTVVNGAWDVVRVDGNRVARLKAGAEFGAINIWDLTVAGFSMQVRLRHVSGDDGANIYFYNNRVHDNIGADLGYWFGISGALDAIGWGESVGGALRLNDIVVSETPLDSWVQLRLSLIDRRASMAVMREVVDEGFIPLFDVGPLVAHDAAESLGLVAAGREVWVDDVLVLRSK